MSDAAPAAGVAFAERAAYLRAADVLVVADLHVGRDEASAVEAELGERADLVERLAALLDRFAPETVVVAGDAVHAFDRVTARSRETLDALREACAARDAALELVAGNHDAALADAWDGSLNEAYVVEERVGDGPVEAGSGEAGSSEAGPVEDGSGEDGSGTRTTAVCHGHEPPSAAADRYVIGHVHPTIEIEGHRRPCVLRGSGTYRGADVIVLPAFTRLAPGVAVNDAVGGGLASPLVPDAAAMAPTVYDADAGGALRFPPLGEFDRLL